MMRFTSAAAMGLALGLLAVPAQAQAQHKPPGVAGPYAPPVPPAYSQQSDLPQAMLDDYDRHCTGDAPSVELEGETYFRLLFAPQDGSPDLLVECADPWRIARVVTVDRVDFALTLLSLRAFEPFWPSMEREWGSGLDTLREEIRALGRTADDSANGLSLRPAVDRAITRANHLRAAGDLSAALALLDTAAAQLDALSPREARDQEFERAMVEITRAGIVSTMTGDRAAADLLGQFMATFPEDSDYAFNPLINRAAFLAEAGDWYASHQLIVPAYAAFRGDDYSPESYQIGGSDREFAWIIACDHWHLDKRDVAQEYIDIVLQAPEQPRDEYFAHVRPSTGVRRRMYRCIGDAEGWFAQFTDGSLPLLDPAWALLQPRSVDTEGPLPGWTVPGDVRARFDSLFRVLPPSYDAALRRWRSEVPAA